MTAVVAEKRIALVGAASHVGAEVKDKLARAGISGKRIDLLDLDDHVGLLTDYGAEARVVLDAASESVASYAVACFCGNPETAQRFAPDVVAAGGVAVDCTGRLVDHERATLAGTPDDAGPRISVIPHPGTLLLSSLAAAVDLGSAVATLLLPASEATETGAEAMARQAADLLNFGETGGEEETPFGRRMAFDAWVDRGDARPRILGELVARGHATPRLAVIRAPVFHALAAAIFVPGQESEGLGDSLRGAGLMAASGTPDRAAIDSPTRVAGRTEVHVTGLSSDGDGSWLWVVADNHHAIAGAAVAVILGHLETEAANAP